MSRYVKLLSLWVVITVGFWLLGVAAEQLDDIISKLVQKESNLRSSVKTMKIVAQTEADFGGQTVITENVIYQKGGKLRSETRPIRSLKDIPEEFLKAISIFDGKDMWVISQGRTQKFPGANLDIGKVNPINDMSWVNTLKDVLKFDGEKTVEGKHCYVLSADEPVPTKIYVDKETLDWIVMEQDLGEDKLKVKRSDFRNVPGVPGIKLPRKLEMFLNGDIIATTVVKSINVNVDIDDDLFEVSKVEEQVNSSAKNASTKTKDSNWNRLEKLAK